MSRDFDPEAVAYRPRQAAAALGVSARTLWQWTRDGIVPCVRVGQGKRRVVLYPAAELKAWLASQAAARPAEGGVR